MLTRIPKILYGGDYNPEQWPREVWGKDIDLMKQAGVNTVSLGVFAWSNLETAEGVYDFTWMDEIVEKLHAAGINIFLATPSAATPAWLDKQYPEVLRCHHTGRRHPHRVRVNYCLSSAKYRERCAAMAGEMASRYGQHPAVIGWHVSNEYHGGCWCETCSRRFQDWLAERYTSIEQLNKAWWTSFWSHSYSSFAEIEPPQPWPDGEWSMQSLWLEWRRFVGVLYTELYDNEVKEIRKYSDLPCTHNMHAYTNDLLLTHWKPLADKLDFVSWDNYPEYQNDKDDITRAAKCGFQHSIYRGLHDNAPFAMMESRPAAGPGCRQQRPGVLRRTVLQALGHGSDTALFFQWRDGRSGIEKFHGSMINHSNKTGTRQFKEIAGVGQELSGLGEILDSRVPSSAVLLFDQETHWAFELGTNARHDDRDYVDTIERYYKAFWDRGINVDVLCQDGLKNTTSHYDLIIAPMLYNLDQDMVSYLEDFVNNGDTLVLSCWSGYADHNDLVYQDGFPGPLKKLAGLWSEELDAPEKGLVSVKMDDNSYPAGAFCDVLNTTTAKTLGIFSNEYYAGRPAFCVNQFGKGRCYYIGFHAEETFLNDLVNTFIEERLVKPLIKGRLPEGVTVQSRMNDKFEYVFIHNFSQQTQHLDVSAENLKTLAGAAVSTLELTPAFSQVFKR